MSGGDDALKCAEGKGGGRERAELVITGGINAAPHLLQNLLVLRAESPHWVQYIDDLVDFKGIQKILKLPRRVSLTFARPNILGAVPLLPVAERRSQKVIDASQSSRGCDVVRSPLANNCMAPGFTFSVRCATLTKAGWMESCEGVGSVPKGSLKSAVSAATSASRAACETGASVLAAAWSPGNMNATQFSGSEERSSRISAT
jgi:hypothetical protein